MRLFEGPRFSQLLRNPESIGISRHIEVQDLASVVAAVQPLPSVGEFQRDDPQTHRGTHDHPRKDSDELKLAAF
jgi:hypothetical protein